MILAISAAVPVFRPPVFRMSGGRLSLKRPVPACPSSGRAGRTHFWYTDPPNGAWRSLVAHLLWEQGVAGSNPAAPTSAGRMGLRP